MILVTSVIFINFLLVCLVLWTDPKRFKSEVQSLTPPQFVVFILFCAIAPIFILIQTLISDDNSEPE